MVSDGAPDPPDNINKDLTPPILSSVDAVQQMDDSEDEMDEYAGYEPLPLGPSDEFDLRVWNSGLMSSDSSEEEEEEEEVANIEPEPMEEIAATENTNNYVPPIESVDREITREVWTTPREETNIEMSSERAQQVMSAMANFSLPTSSFPEWAHSITEEEWKHQLATRINSTSENR